MASKRSRRSAEQLRQDLLGAAQEVFAEKGYAAASMREIAKRANAAPPLIFRHFNKKSQLFAEAVFTPIEQMLDEHIVNADSYYSPDMSASDRLRKYAALVIGTFRSHKRLLIAYLNAISFHSDEFSELCDQRLTPISFENRLINLERMKLEYPAGENFYLADSHFEIRIIMMVFYSVALFDDLFFVGEERDYERELRSVVKLIGMGTGLDLSGDDKPEVGRTDRHSPALAEQNRALELENASLRSLLIKTMLDLHKAQS